LAVQVIERATESARPAGPESGGGTAERARRRATDLVGDAAQGAPLAEASFGAGTSFGASLASLLGAERPAEVQGKAIDHRRETIEASRRQTVPGAERDGAPDEGVTEREDPSEALGPDAIRTTDRASVGRGAATSAGSGNGRAAPNELSDVGAEPAAPTGRLLRPEASPPQGSNESGSDSHVVGTAQSAGTVLSPNRVGAADRGAAGVRTVSGAADAPGVTTRTSDGGGGVGSHANGSGARAALNRLVSIGSAARTNGGATRSASPFVMEEPTPGAQIARGLAQALTGKGGTVTLRLRPEHLGQVTAHVKIEHGVVGVRIEASSEEARALLERESSVLRASLESRGMEVGHVRVEISSRSDERTTETGAWHGDGGGAHTDTGGDRPDAEDRRERGDGSRGSDRSAWRTDAHHSSTNARSAASGGAGTVDLSGGYVGSGPLFVRDGPGLVVRLDATA
jgi:hypothetical protein